MSLQNPVFKIILLVILGRTITGCKSAADIPFPQDDGYAQPVTVPLKFGSTQRLLWPEKASNLSSVTASFNYDKLPVFRFDSSGFISFPQPPEETGLDMSHLPGSGFNFDSLPEIPLRFKTWVLPPPDITKATAPVINNKSEIVYQLGGLLNGFPVSSLCKSKYGFTWIGTARGLFRYDGDNTYFYDINGFIGGMFDMVEDRDGKLWIATFARGILVLDIKNGVIRQCSTREGLLYDLVPRVMVDHENRIWASCLPITTDVRFPIIHGAVAIIDQDKKTIRFLQKSQGLSTNSPSGFLEDRDQNVWIATLSGGLNILDFKNNRIQYLDRAHGLNTDSMSAMYQDRSGVIWAGGFFSGLNQIDPGKRTIKRFTEKQGFGRAFTGRILEDRSGSLWIGLQGSEGQVKIIDPSRNHVKILDQSDGLPERINSEILEDARHQFLIGGNSSLNMIYKDGIRIHRVGNNSISTLMEDSHGRIWIGTLEHGIQIVDTVTGLAKLYNHAHGLSDDLIQSLVQYNDEIILSTQKGGIEIIDTSLKKIERIGVAQGLATANITTIAKDGKNNIWLGGLGRGIDVIDLPHKKIWHVGLGESLNDSTIIDIKKDRQDRLWFYSRKIGVGIIDVPARTVRKIVQSEFASLTGAAENNMILHDSHANVWVASSTDGLFIINTAGDSVTHFTTAQGLLSNKITSINEFDGRIYAGTSEGLSILTPPGLAADKRWKIVSFGRGYGITKNARTYNSDLMLRNGRYWWGDLGITIFNNLDEVANDSIIPPTYITGFDIYNRRQFFVSNPWENSREEDTIWNSGRKSDTFFVNHGPTPQLSVTNRGGLHWDSLDNRSNLPVNLRLPYNRNYLQFHYVQAHLGSQDTVWYRYILEGVDQEWSEKTYKVSSENYPGIAPGEYTFKVASLFRGRWSDPAVYKFTIAPPWWKTWWAWLIYCVIILGLVRALIEYRSRSLVREKKMLEQNVKLRTEEVLKQKEEISAQRDNIEQALDELKATQSQLIQSEKMASLGELTAGIAHEIQNPLNFINNFSEVNTELIAEMKAEIEKGNLEEVKNIADDIAVNEQKINHHGKRADGIVKGMLQHSRTGNRQKEAANINNIADEYLRLAYHGLRAKDKTFNAQVHTDFDDSITSVRLIPQDIGRVILNLITNAFYAVTEKKKQLGDGYDPTVSVSTKKTGNHVEVRVRDNGNGIPQKVLEKIFQPFFTTKPAGEGTGLGLSLSYDIVKAHQGDLSVNTKEGEYAEFIMQLPI